MRIIYDEIDSAASPAMVKKKKNGILRGEEYIKRKIVVNRQDEEI